MAAPGDTLSPPTDALQVRLAELSDLVDGALRAEVEPAIQPPAETFGAMLAYHLGWRDEHLRPLTTTVSSGKRLRPVLALLVCEAVCGSVEPALQAAVAVELIHNFSLVHDDIQDHSDLRRHRPTLWKLWGAAQGINAGDALFTLAQAVLLRHPWASAAEMAQALNQACLRLVEGQYLDLELQEGRVELSLALYEAMIERKTGALFACACRLGAMAAGASLATIDAFARYGRELGLAFQEQDDVIGVWSSPDESGKPAAADIVERKRGLPAALALSRPDAPAWLRALYAGHGEMGAEDVHRVIAHFESLGLRAETEARVEVRYRAALAALDLADGADPARTHLVALCGALGMRRS